MAKPKPKAQPSTPEQRAQWRKNAKVQREKHGSVRNLTIFLGVEEERLRRTDALDRLAGHFRMNRSEFIREIADGNLVVRAKAPSRH